MNYSEVQKMRKTAEALDPAAAWDRFQKEQNGTATWQDYAPEYGPSDWRQQQGQQNKGISQGINSWMSKNPMKSGLSWTDYAGRMLGISPKAPANNTKPQQQPAPAPQGRSGTVDAGAAATKPTASANTPSNNQVTGLNTITGQNNKLGLLSPWLYMSQFKG